MKYKVIKEFPGLKVDDILVEEEGTGFYVNKKGEADMSEDSESLFINTVALSKDVVEGELEFFAPILEKVTRQINQTENIKKSIDGMAQTAALLESDLVMAINEYHHGVLTNMINSIYEDINLLTKIIDNGSK